MAGLFGNPGDNSVNEPSALKKLLLSYEKDGEITKDDIERFLNELGSFPSEEEIQEKINVVDNDDNGILDLNEFLHFLQNELQITDTEEDVVEAFKVFDKDGNGFINAAEIRRVMTNLGDKLTDDEVDQMIRMSDLDGDGQVNYEEFVRIMMGRIRQYEKLSPE